MTWKAWRRKPEAGACAFCLALASRGAVYRTRVSAGGADKFHTHCRCKPQVEESFDRRKDTAIDPADANRLIKLRVTHWNRPGAPVYRYQYRLDGGQVRIPDPPRMALPDPPPLSSLSGTGVAAAEVAEGAVTVQRLASVRAQLALLTVQLSRGVMDAQRRHLEGRITDLTAEQFRLAEVFGT